MKRAEKLMLGCLMVAATATIGQTNRTQQESQVGKVPQRAQVGNADRGQEVFQQNCSRCHQEPQGFPSSVSGTIARHMRVRAGLSEEDYKALLKFLNP